MKFLVLWHLDTGRPGPEIVKAVTEQPNYAKKLEADGIKFDMAPRDMTAQIGLKIAFVTDPNGTYIELTQGLSAK